jgi:hypothetical protein
MAVPSSGQLRLNADINLEINGTGTGTDVSLNGLSASAGFTAPNGMKEFYGYVDAIVPSVTTNATSGVTASSVIANGNVTADGGATVTNRGFYFGTSSSYASNSKYQIGSGTGAFSNNFTGLASNTTYYITAYAINSVGETVGSTTSQLTSFNYTFNSVQIKDESYTYGASVGAYYVNVANAWVAINTNVPNNFSCVSWADNRPNIFYAFNMTASYVYAQCWLYVSDTSCGGSRTVNTGSISKSNSQTAFTASGSRYIFQSNGGGGSTAWARWSWN